MHRAILKEYDNKFWAGYYSESDQKKEVLLNIKKF